MRRVFFRTFRFFRIYTLQEVVYMTEIIRNFFSSSLDSLQEEQVRLGRQNGLTAKDVHIYAKPSYNWMMMQEIRLILENETDTRRRRQLIKETVRPQRERMRQLLFPKALTLKEDGIWIGVLVLILLSVILFLRISLMRIRNRPFLNLQEEAVLQEGASFDPAAYVLSHSEGNLTCLTPQIDTGTAGDRVAVYLLAENGEEIIRMMPVHILE